MAALSHIAPPGAQNGLKERRLAPSDAHKDGTKTGVRGHGENGKVSKIQTLLEVMKCELSKPGKVENGAGKEGEPTKLWTPLCYAVYHRRGAALAHFLRAGQSPDGAVGCEVPPLCIAVAAGYGELVHVLCNARANVDASTKRDGETALHMAIKSGNDDMVRTLLSYGPDVNAKTKETLETPLHYAAKTQSIATVTALLKGGANYAALDAKGGSPAEVALQLQNLHVAVAIVSAARGQNNHLVKEKGMLLKHVEKVQNRSLPNNELIADIIEAGCPPNSTPLIEAIKKGGASLVELFLSKGSDPNQPTMSGLLPIFAALNSSGTQIVQALVFHKADITLRDRDGLTVLQVTLQSAVHSKEDISTLFDIFLEKGTNTQTRYPDGSTLLHRVVAKEIGLAKVAQQLLQHVGANEQDQFGNTALHYAINNRSCIAVLLKHGANVNVRNHKGLTPLLHAIKVATKEKEPDLEPIIRASNLGESDTTGRTALHLASRNGLERTIRTLIQFKANTTSLDAQNRTPLLTAVLHHQWHAVSLLAVHPGTNSWDQDGLTALHHIAMSTPKFPSTWKDIASAIVPFCEKGVGRSMRDRTGATPLIVAVKTLPQEGLPVIEALLLKKSNCVGHEDLGQRDALFYAASLGKLGFLAALLQCGAPLMLTDWRPGRERAQMDSDSKVNVLKMMAEYELLRRITALHCHTTSAPKESMLPQILPLCDLEQLLAMRLDPNAPLPKSKPNTPLLWILLKQVPSLPPEYLHGALTLLFASGADPNALSKRTHLRITHPRNSVEASLTIHPLTHLLSQHPTISLSTLALFLTNDVSLSIPSTFHECQYPLHSAILANRLDVINLFLTHTPDHLGLNATDAKHRTPLFLAAETRFVDAIEALTTAGAKVDFKDKDGNTALHMAALSSHEECVRALLKRGAKACKLNSKGLTPRNLIPTDAAAAANTKQLAALLKYAEEQDHRETMRLPALPNVNVNVNVNINTIMESDDHRDQQHIQQEMMMKKKKKSAPPKIHISHPSIDVHPVLIATPLHMTRHKSQSIQYTPPTSPLSGPKSLSPSPSKKVRFPFSTPFSAPTSPQIQVRAQGYPRIDSGINFGRGAQVLASMASVTCDGEKEEEDVNRGRSRKRVSEDEFAAWLAASKVMEGI